jgi:aminopeptidase
MENGMVQRLAELAVGVGANVQPGQIVAVHSEPGKEYLARAVAEAAYKLGARFVDLWYFDPYAKRARIAYAPDDTLEFVPSWYGARMLALGEEHGARIVFSGPATPGLLDGLDPVRAGRDRLPQIKESVQVLNERKVNWTILPCPSQPWAELVHPDLEPEAALEKLWEQIAYVCRLDADDPLAAWKARATQLKSAAQRLADRAFDALHYQGPGTDLTVGLLPACTWTAAQFETLDGIVHLPNVPTEEVFTSPDPERTEGVVSASKPLVLLDGTVIRDLVMRFEGGHVVEATASSGQETLRTILKRDENAGRLGECALVDREGRIGELDTVFYDTLLDENAASHLAIGTGFPSTVPEEVRDRVNESEIHLDFMIGSPALDVTGITTDGERVEVLMGGDWKI